MPTEYRRFAAAAVAVLLLAVGCRTAVPQQLDHATPAAADAPAVSAADAPPGAATPTLQASFSELAAAIPATIGLAIAPVGENTVSSFGAWSSGVAWSTIKVPLAIATLRVKRSGAEALTKKAITESDNAAAEQLWSELGPPEQAAEQVQAILKESGDATTIVESRRLRPGFTAFGQTQWPLERQAQFAARLPCLADTGNVVDLMYHLVDEQRWGLAADGAAAKGGWGPGQSSGYLVRQFGIVSTTAGKLGVALAAEPHAGTFGAGINALNRMTEWLTAHVSELPTGSCPG
jgi:hypothetical protein